ncbi:MAG: trigger factor [Candidatus Omnitrophota bacterium]
MKNKIKKLAGTARQFEIEVPKERVAEATNRVLEDIRKKAAVPGFRIGKAPADIIRKRHYGDAMDEAKQLLIPEAYQEALEEHGINPISYPEVSEVNLAPSGSLLFKAKVDISPEVKVQNYKGMKVISKDTDVTDAEFEEALTRVINLQTEFSTTDRPLQKGDFGICTVEMFLDGKTAAKKRDKMWIEVDKEASLLGMGEDLLGMKTGESKDIETVLPENYPDKKYAGKKVMFKVQVNETKEKKVPVLDDALAKKLGKDTAEEIRREVRAQLAERKKANAGVDMKNQILTQLLGKNSFDLPESMIKRQFKVLMERAGGELAQKGMDEAAIESHKEKLKDSFLKEARNKVQAYFILDEIARRENVEATDADVDEWIKALARSYNQPFDEVKKYYSEHGLMGGLKEQLKEEKTLDFLLEEAHVAKKGGAR